MSMLAILLLAEALAAAPAEKPAGHVGACAWERLPVADRTVVLDAYHRDRSLGLQTLMLMDEAVEAALKACSPKARTPAIYLRRAIWAEMTQVGAARELSVIQLDRIKLEAAWVAAPAAARLCLHNRVGANTGQATPPCADDVEGALARSLKIERVDLVLQASIFYLAKAESEWAESLIANSPF